ncbi:serine/threonine-protein kinase [Streptomyces sp. NPDC055721]|uniref:serine/threonine-protein kinase n=1 Tax=Streptomyces sp. NPDC127132 TaxID=3345374 RepID=UPI00362D390D
MALRDNDPREIGGYALLDRLGAGGMGTVFLAQAESGRPVALKVVHEQFAADAEFRTRFRQEVRAARRVSGAFTAPVVDADPDAARPWMATTYVPGQTLRSRVESEGPLSGAELRRLAVGLVEALREMHQVRVIHRDLKPDNVLLTEDGPRVIDFGISRAADHQTLTVTGRILGTPPFMSPEQLSAPHRVTPASDVFSLGAVLVYATTSRGPFDAGSPYMTAYNVVHEPPEVAELSGTVREIVQWCLAKEPEERPDPAGLLDAFRKAPVADWGRRPAAPSPVDPETRRPRRLRPARRVILASAVALAVLAGAGTYLTLRDRGRGGVGTDPVAANRPALTDAAAVGAAVAYQPVLGGNPSGSTSYGDGPWRQPSTWLPWVSGRGIGPCVYELRSLLCTSASGARTPRRVVRLDGGSGTEMWSVPTDVVNDQPPAVVGDTMVVTVADGLRGFDVMTGTVKWSLSVGEAVRGLTADNRRVYGTTKSGGIVAADVTRGRLAWQRPVITEGGVPPTMRVAHGQLHVLRSLGKGRSAGYRVTALDAVSGAPEAETRLSAQCSGRDLTVFEADMDADGDVDVDMDGDPDLVFDRDGDGVVDAYHLTYFCHLPQRDGEPRSLLVQGFRSTKGTVLRNVTTAPVTVTELGLFATPTVPSAGGIVLRALAYDGRRLWESPTGIQCGADAVAPVVTGQRLYLLCEDQAVVVDLRSRKVVSRPGVPHASMTPAAYNSYIVAGGLFFVPTEQRWGSYDAYRRVT